MSQKKTYTLTLNEPFLGIRTYEFEREFEHENDAIAYLQEIVSSGVIPEDVQDEYNDTDCNSEQYPSRIAGNDLFAGMSGTILNETKPLRSAYTVASEDTRDQRAFTWLIADGELQTWPIGFDSGAISSNVLIARPCEGEPTGVHEYAPATGTRFYRSGDGRVWEVIFTFKQPE